MTSRQLDALLEHRHRFLGVIDRHRRVSAELRRREAWEVDPTRTPARDLSIVRRHGVCGLPL
jgi:hypothetical protein